MAKQQQSEKRTNAEGEAVVPLAAGATVVDHGTRTDDNVERPGTVQPGDTPYDTLDPSERVSSVPVRPGEEAVMAGTVNAVLVNPVLTEIARGEIGPDAGRGSGEQRTERYEIPGPTGRYVTVEHNIDTGDTRVV